MRRRRANRAPALTPLLDVLFILLFASLIQARSAVQSATIRATEAASPPEQPDAGIVDAVDASVDAAVDAGPQHPQASRDAAAPHDSAYLQASRALAGKLAGSVRNIDVYLVEVNARGYVVSLSLWSAGREVRRDHTNYRLLRPVLPSESDEEFEYLGSAETVSGVCSLARRYFSPDGPPSNTDPNAESRAMVVVIVQEPLADLPLALTRGLKRDLASCFDEIAGLGILFEPGDDLDGIH